MRMIRRLIALSLTIVMIIAISGILPQRASEVHATDGEPAMTLGTSALKRNAGQASGSDASGDYTVWAQTLWYGGEAWLVMSYDGKFGNGNPIQYTPTGSTEPVDLFQSNAVTLLLRDITETTPFNQDASKGAVYATSDYRAYLAEWLSDGTRHKFSQSEQSAMLPRSMEGGNNYQSIEIAPDRYETNPDYDPNKIMGPSIDGQYIWPLSEAEARALPKGLINWQASDEAYYSYHYGYYLMRTPGEYPGLIGNLDGGDVYGDINVDDSLGVRPAIELNTDNILLTSPAVNGKTCGEIGADSLQAIGTRTEEEVSKEWKVTVKDEDHDNFSISISSRDNDLITVQYDNAQTGDNEYISAVIVDRHNKITYYGRVKEATEASGSAQINVANKMNSGDRIYVLNEQINGDKKTDFASDFKEIIEPHELEKTNAVEPTCTGPGNKEYWTCTICGRYFADDQAVKEIEEDSWIIPAAGHALEDDFTVDKEPTCTTEGSKSIHCTKCNVTKYSVSIPALGHTWGEWEEVTSPTCTDAGSEKRVCSVCHTEETRGIDPNGHSWNSDFTVDQEPTCTTDGSKSVHCAKCNATNYSVTIPATGHDWGEGKVTKEATVTADGEKKFVCKNDPKHVKTEVIPKKGSSDSGSGVAPGASEKEADETIRKSKSDDPAGTVFGLLQARATKVTKKTVKVQWTKVPGAKKYVVYGNKCGIKNKYKKQKKTAKLSLVFKEVAGRKVKKGTYYKFLVVALDKNGKVIATSKTVHAATKGGKVGNDKRVETKAKNGKVSIKAGKTFNLKAKAIPQSGKRKVRRHRKVAYESSNTKVATVSRTGVIKGKAKGTCTAYAYAQNGIFAKIKVTVK